MLSALLALVYDRIAVSGDNGVAVEELREHVKAYSRRPTKNVSITVHRINDALEMADSDVRIDHYRVKATNRSKKGIRWDYFYFLKRKK